MQPLDTGDVLELCVILIIRGSLAIRRGQYRCPAIVQKEQQGIFRCRAGVGGQGSHAAMESPEALMCPLEKGVRGIETSGSGYLRQQIRGGRKGRTECQGLGQSPYKITMLGGLR